MTVVGTAGRLGCANHAERGSCMNRRKVAPDAVLGRVLVGLKERLLAPKLVEEFVRAYVAEVNAANRERGARQASLQAELGKLDWQVRNLLELIKDGHGSGAMVAELRVLEARREALAGDGGHAGADARPAHEPAGVVPATVRGAQGGAGRRRDSRARC